MSMYEEGLQLMEEKFGGYKDNLVSLATISLETSKDGKPCPCVRVVDAYYENGTFYVVTYGKSNKMLQIVQNREISIATSSEMFNADAVGENLGWVLDPKNGEIRTKLRKTFEWYDEANNENDENCVFLAIHLTKGILNINHWEKLYHMDFVNKTCE